jgi:iron complex outermembrane receptor protein
MIQVKTRYQAPASAVSAVVGLLLSTPALAQRAPASNAQTIGEVIVTARRVEERLQDVPISISVLNQKQLAKNNIVSASDLVTASPSLSANTNFGSQNSSFALRGFVQENGTSPAVGVYFADVVAPRAISNGLPAGDGAGPGSFFDLQSVQVLNGPQGTLFGRNTTGGAVLLVPQRPTDQFEGYVEGSIGDYAMRRLQAVINIPVDDKLRVRLGVDRMTRDGYLRNNSGVGPSDFDDVDYVAARVSVVADITPNLENYTVGSYSRSNTHGDFGKLIGADPAAPLGPFFAEQLTPGAPNFQGSGFYDAAQNLPSPRSLLTQWQLINTTTWQASDNLTVKNIISYAQLQDNYDNPIFGTNIQSPAIAALGIPSFPLNFSWAMTQPGIPTAHESTFTEELRLAGHTDDHRLDWQGGVYFESVRPVGEVGSIAPVFESCATNAAVINFQCYDVLGFLGALAGGTTPGGFIDVTKGETSFRNIGVYAQATYAITDQLKITGGYRYTWDRENNYSIQTTTYTAFPPNPLGLTHPAIFPSAPFTICSYPNVINPDPTGVGGCRRNFSGSWSAPTWLLDLDYAPSRDVLLYVNWKRGYRTGGISPNVTPPFEEFRAEKVDTYEIGAKTAFHAAVSGTFNIAAFYNDFSNQQLQLGLNPLPGAPVPFTAAPINAGKSQIWGIEVNSSLRLTPDLSLDLGYTYLNTRILQISIPTLPPGSLYAIAGGGYRVGDPLLLSPHNKVTATATYDLPLDASFGRVALSATFTHTDRMFVNPSDRDYMGYPGSTAASIAALQADSWVAATNLLNLNIDWANVMQKNFDLSFFMTNVTGQEYLTFKSGLASSLGIETGQVGPPRMFGVRARAHF